MNPPVTLQTIRRRSLHPIWQAEPDLGGTTEQAFSPSAPGACGVTAARYNQAVRWISGRLALFFVPLIGITLCGRCSGQITGTVTSSQTGKPIADALVMGGGLINWVQTDSDGHYSMAQARFKGPKAPPEVPISFRAEGYRPVTRIAPSQKAVLDIVLEDGASSEWKVPLCRDAWRTTPLCGRGLAARTHETIGFEMLVTLPCDAKKPRAYSDVDYSGHVISYTKGGKTHYLRTMSGPTCCSGHPSDDVYLSSRSFIERGWMTELNQRRIDGLDARGVSMDGTYWRWVGPLLGGFVEYEGVDLDASKYFDAILDSICFQPRF
jgi:hypothetical protein